MESTGISLTQTLKHFTKGPGVGSPGARNRVHWGPGAGPPRTRDRTKGGQWWVHLGPGQVHPGPGTGPVGTGGGPTGDQGRTTWDQGWVHQGLGPMGTRGCCSKPKIEFSETGCNLVLVSQPSGPRSLRRSERLMRSDIIGKLAHPSAQTRGGEAASCTFSQHRTFL